MQDTKNESNNLIGKVVNCQALNIREEPSKDSDIIGVLKNGTIVEIEFSINGFYMVYTNYGISGYCMEDFIELVDER